MVSPFLGLAVFWGRTVFCPLPFLGLQGLCCVLPSFLGFGVLGVRFHFLFPWIGGLSVDVLSPVPFLGFGVLRVSLRFLPSVRSSDGVAFCYPIRCVPPFFSPMFRFLFLSLDYRFWGSVPVSPRSMPSVYGFLPLFLGFAVSGHKLRFRLLLSLDCRVQDLDCVSALFPWISGLRAWFVFCPFPFLEVAVLGVNLRFLTGLFPCFFGS